MGFHWGFDGGVGILWLVSVLAVVLFWGLVIAALVLGIRWLIRADRSGRAQPPPPSAPSEDPLDILRRRYAAGEIDDEEYQRRRKTLTG